MTHQQQALQVSAGTDKVAGCWKLAEGRALTLRARYAGVLRIAHGGVWVTFNNAQSDDGVRGGDHFLGAGDTLHLLPGQTLVMESLKAEAHSAAYFSWYPLPATAGVVIANRRAPVFSRNPAWRTGVLQPLSDLRAAFALAGAASVRLLTGLAGALGAALLAVVPRFALDAADRVRSALAERAFNAQSRASRAHCAINRGDSMASSGAL